MSAAAPPIPPGAPGARGLLAAIRAEGRGRLWMALVFLTLGTLSEGASILMALPILHVLNSGDGSGLHLGGQGPFGLNLPDVSLGLPALLGALVGLVAAAAVFNRAKAVHLAELMADFTNTHRARLFRAIAGARWDDLARRRGADLELALTGEADRTRSAAILILTLIQAAVMLVVYAGLGLLVSAPMTLAVLAAGVLALAALRPFRRAAADYGGRLRAAREAQFRSAADFLAGLKTARALGLGEAQAAGFERLLAEAKADASAYARRVATGAGAFQVALAAGAAAFVLAATGWAGLSTAEVVVLLLLLLRLAPRFLALQAQAQQLLVDLPAWDRAVTLQRDLLAAAEPAAPALAPLPAPRAAIGLEAIAHRHGPDAPWVLQDCTLNLRAGEIAGLVGPSGAGKTTLADILAGFLVPDRGHLVIDGRALGPADLPRWRASVGYLPQDAFLLPATIRENLLAAAPGATGAEIDAAIELAAADFVHRLPQGLATQVGDRGALLSGGERQRIALARAFLRRPRLLILDEATAALDGESQARVAAGLRGLRGETTVLTIAHRLSMAAVADRVHVLEAGRIVESGAWADLIASPGSRLAALAAAEAGEIADTGAPEARAGRPMAPAAE
jgi:ATP-binding cassette subfamily C protein